VFPNGASETLTPVVESSGSEDERSEKLRKNDLVSKAVESFEEFLGPPKPSGWFPHRSAPAGKSFGCYDPRNIQTRYLSSTASAWGSKVAAAPPNVTRAEATAADALFVGLVELYPESECLFMARTTDDAPPAYCACESDAKGPSLSRTSGPEQGDCNVPSTLECLAIIYFEESIHTSRT
jgi:hypothetical protein